MCQWEHLLKKHQSLLPSSSSPVGIKEVISMGRNLWRDWTWQEAVLKMDSFHLLQMICTSRPGVLRKIRTSSHSADL